MIEINLLPEEFKEKKRRGGIGANLPVVQIFIGILAILVSSHILILFCIGVNKGALSKLKKEWEAESPKRKEIEALKKKVSLCNTKIETIESLAGKRVLWAEKLNALSDSVTDNTWLSNLTYDKKTSTPTLILEGYAVGIEEDVGNFMKKLEDNSAFFSGLEGIELGYTKAGRIENNDVTSFKLICTFLGEKDKSETHDKSGKFEKN